ncbi:MAG TPA: DNA polymerase III subunit gamma/tau [Gammaproteobacteria bacterium]|nr:DNA polymerase III subunit gamma/tau [Gammaproteobacteria bacterium]
MTYQVLARKYRPRVFNDLVGQEHVLRALIHALDNDRLHHAFLFTGTRGVGKTTIARILAKCLNCEKGVRSQPCGECSACQEIDAGRFIDLIEVDAASRTKVDDTRELLDNVQYAPTVGRYKVYLIDEVHMLSTHSFNALLKTLEEPPPHVKFLLATTDPQKLPVTVLSRCLQFNLKRLPAGLIAEHLEKILGLENITAEQGALGLIARAADGSIRDALSLLDQAIPYSDGQLIETDVRTMLGTVERRHVITLLECLAANDAPGLLESVEALDSQAPDYAAVLEELAVLLQRLALLQTLSGKDDDAALMELAKTLDAQTVQLYYQIAIIGRRDLPLAPEPRAGFEMILLRMLSFAPAPLTGNLNEGGQNASKTGDKKTAKAPAKPIATSKNNAPESVTVEQSAHKQSNQATPNWQDPDWQGLISALDLSGMTRELAANCIYEHRNGNTLHLRLGENEKQLLTERSTKRLAEALSRFYQEKLNIKIATGDLPKATPAQQAAARDKKKQQQAQESIASDPNVRALQETFNAEVDPNSIHSH